LNEWNGPSLGMDLTWPGHFELKRTNPPPTASHRPKHTRLGDFSGPGGTNLTATEWLAKTNYPDWQIIPLYSLKWPGPERCRKIGGLSYLNIRQCVSLSPKSMHRPAYYTSLREVYQNKGQRRSGTVRPAEQVPAPTRDTSILHRGASRRDADGREMERGVGPGLLRRQASSGTGKRR
jgi:hypothetical protein